LSVLLCWLTSQEEWEYSNREDAMEQIKSDKMVMTFLHSRVKPFSSLPSFSTTFHYLMPSQFFKIYSIRWAILSDSLPLSASRA